MILKTIHADAIPESELRTCFDAMSKERQTRCKGIKNPTAQKCCIVADALARESVAEYLKIPPNAVEILHTTEGKPYVKDNPCYFSLSHSGDLVVCALSARPVGVDAEEIRPLKTEIAEKICTVEELEELAKISDPKEKNLFLLRTWTRKEALFKIGGTLPRNDRNTDTLHPSNAEIQTQNFETYLISVAEKILTPEYSS